VAVLAAGCSGGDDDEQRAAPAAARATWPGPPAPTAGGRLPVAGFNRFLDGRPQLARSALKAGIEFARLDRAQARTTSATARTGPEGAPPTVVAVTADGLLDDSVRTERYTLVFRKRGAGWRLASARVAWRCWRGRGHTQFSPALCR
jgi:hypothetical protein